MSQSISLDLKSPFSLAFEPRRAELPRAFVEQYLLPVEADYRIVLSGQLQHVWRNHRWTRFLFNIAAMGNTLFPETGENISTRVEITAKRDPDGLPQHHWERCFRFKSATRYFISDMVFDPATQLVVEKQGPGNILQTTSAVRFIDSGRLEFIPVKTHLQWGRLKIPLPKWLFFKTHAVEWIDPENEDTIHVRFTVSHWLTGELFGYQGVFKVVRRPLV